MRLLGSLHASTGTTSAWRVGMEWTLRALAGGLLTWCLVQMLGARRSVVVEVSTSTELASRLARWSTVSAPARVHVALDERRRVVERDWLAALPGVGTVVRWSGTALIPTAAAMEPIADPTGGADLAVAAPKNAPVELRDLLGPFDTVTAGAYGVRIHLPSPPAQAAAAVGRVVAQAALRDSLQLRRLLLLAHAGWEAKFVQAALEERGWKVDAFLAFSPKGEGDIHQGKVGAIDTSTYSAVLAVDTIAARYTDQIMRYVQSGGGLVLWGEAAHVPAFAALAPGSIGPALPERDDAPSNAAPRLALTLTPLTHLESDALVLERRDQQPALAARRIGAGRVLEIGYIDTWRWRMAGVGNDAPAAHRAWLARLVAVVAYTGRREISAPAVDVAPLATLVDQLGPASASAPASRERRIALNIESWIFGILVAALLIEWTSRRLRGVR